MIWPFAVGLRLDRTSAASRVAAVLGRASHRLTLSLRCPTWLTASRTTGPAWQASAPSRVTYVRDWRWWPPASRSGRPAARWYRSCAAIPTPRGAPRRAGTGARRDPTPSPPAGSRPALGHDSLSDPPRTRQQLVGQPARAVTVQAGRTWAQQRRGRVPIPTATHPTTGAHCGDANAGGASPSQAANPPPLPPGQRPARAPRRGRDHR
jgi:hypothetical protein